MIKKFAIGIALAIFVITSLATFIGCDGAVRGGASILLEDVSVGSLSTEGKPITGLPSQKVDLLLKVSANQIKIKTEGNKTIVTISPSGAKVIISPENTMFDGIKPEQVEIKWQVPDSTKE